MRILMLYDPRSGDARVESANAKHPQGPRQCRKDDHRQADHGRGCLDRQPDSWFHNQDD